MISQSAGVLERWARAIFLVSLVAFTIDFLSQFPRTCLSEPLTRDDYAVHFIDSVEASRFFAASLRIWGYNPFYLAGYPSGIFVALSNHWASLVQFVWGWLLPQGLAFNVAVFVAYWTMPLLALIAGRNFGVGRANAVLFSVSSMIFIRGFSLSTDFINAGMYGFTFATGLSCYAASVLYKYVHVRSHRSWLELTVAGAFTLFVHPLALVMLPAFMLPMLLVYRREITVRDVGRFGCSAAAVLLVNLVWLAPTLHFRGALTDLSAYFQTPFPEFLFKYLRDTAFALIHLLGLLSLYSATKAKDRLAASLLMSYGIVFTVSFFGSYVGLANIEPGRFVFPLSFLALLAISQSFARELHGRNTFFLGAVALLLISLCFVRDPITLVCGYPARAQRILAFIETKTTKNARVHVQDSANHPYFSSHFAAFIPFVTSREIVASKYTFIPATYGFSQFIDGRIFGKRAATLTEDQLRAYLDLYNIRYFLTYDARRAPFLRRTFQRVFMAGGLAIYEYPDGTDSFCYQCTADVRAAYDTIAVENARSPVTILKYHYIDTLRIKPETLRMRPVRLLDDPVPFIKVENGDTSAFTIYNP